MKFTDFLKRNEVYLLPPFLFLLTILSRIPFTSKYLYHMDSVQFALALDKFDVTVHQPHPPGYFLYVMLGRLLHLFIHNANTVFVTISIFFSGLTVVVVYFLGKEMFARKIGMLAALIAMTSPSLWFHGEVALTYVVEAFFSTIIALLCWKIYKGEHRYIWCSALVLGLAGGVRQNSLVFLLPLWIFCIKGVLPRKVILSFVLLGSVTLLWFIPMIIMTGGLNAYNAALRELWLFNTGHHTVFSEGLSAFNYHFLILFAFTFYGLGSALFIILLALYAVLKNVKQARVDKSVVMFFLFWIVPSITFYLLIFIHPANPGYALSFLPALYILAAVSVTIMTDEFMNLTSRDLSKIFVSVLLLINICIYFMAKLPVSNRTIKDNGMILKVVLDDLKSLNSSNTAVFTGPYNFWGYRQIMYYLPVYRVYQMDYKLSPSGELRKIFWGVNRRTFQTKDIVLPGNIKYFAVLLKSDNKKRIAGIGCLRVKQIFPNLNIVTGPAGMLGRIYPETIFSSSKNSG